MTKRKIFWWWRVYTLCSTVYLVTGQTYWRLKINQIHKEKSTLIVVPSSKFTQNNLSETHLQEVDANVAFDGCGSSGHSWPTSTVQVQFDSGYTLTYPHLALAACPSPTSLGPEPDRFRARLTFWQGNLLVIGYDPNSKRAVFPINHNPYVGFNPAQDVFAFFMFQVAALVVYNRFLAHTKAKAERSQKGS